MSLPPIPEGFSLEKTEAAPSGLPPIPDGFMLEEAQASTPLVPEGFAVETPDQQLPEPTDYYEMFWGSPDFPASMQLASRLVPGGTPLPGKVGDFYDSAKGAFIDSAASVAGAFGLMGSDKSEQVSDFLYEQGEQARMSRSAEARASDQKKWVNDDNSIGEAWGDVNSWINIGGQAAGSLAAVITGGGPLKAGAESAIKGISKAFGKTVSKKTADDAAGVIGYGALEGLMMGGSAGKEVQETILAMPPEVLAESPAFIGAFEELKNDGYEDAEAAQIAKETIALSSARSAMAGAGSLGVLLGAVGGKYLNDALTGRFADDAVKGAATLAAAEGTTESLQGAGQQFVQNLNIQTADLTQDLSEGVLNAGVAEGIGGGLAGGGLGALSGLSQDLTVEPAGDFSDVEIPEFFDQGQLDAPEPTPRLEAPEPAAPEQLGEPALRIEDKDIIYGEAPPPTRGPIRNDGMEGEFPAGYNIEAVERDQATDYVVDGGGNATNNRERGVLVAETKVPDFIGQEDAPPMTPTQQLEEKYKPLKDISITQEFAVEDTDQTVEVSERADRLFSKIDKRRGVLTKLLECVG